MCGINLIISENKEWKEQKIKKMMRISHKRGPDNNDVLLEKNIALGHNLLSITGYPYNSRQPVFYRGDEDTPFLVLAFNGEIYNYKELSKQLNYPHEIKSDTEVLAVGLRQLGINFLQKCDGMYAIILWDEKENKIWLARDPSGTKPIYYTNTGEFFAASSMVECLLELGISRQIDKFALQLYETFGFVPGPLTLVENIKKLVPGEILKIDAGSRQIEEAFLFEEKIKEEKWDAEELREKISLTVRDCLIGRRKVGLYLSGGLDSSIILTEALKYNPNIETFTTRFQTNNPKDDAIFNSDANIAARYAANLGVNYRELLITPQDFCNAVESCIKALEEPRSNPNVPAYYLLNKFVSENNIIVTLSGDGGDEAFGGYKHHLNYKKCNSKYEYILELIKNRSLNLDKYLNPYIWDYLVEYLPNKELPCYINTNLWYESYCHLPEDYLIRNDKLGMNFSMEARFPFTSRRLKNYVLGIPGKEKFDFTKTGLTKPFKILLKKAYKGILPDYILEKEKSGWSIPKRYYLDYLKKHRELKINSGSPTKDALYIYFDVWKKLFNINS